MKNTSCCERSVNDYTIIITVLIMESYNLLQPHSRPNQNDHEVDKAFIEYLMLIPTLLVNIIRSNVGPLTGSCS